jgi:hypothetical protein
MTHERNPMSDFPCCDAGEHDAPPAPPMTHRELNAELRGLIDSLDDHVTAADAAEALLGLAETVEARGLTPDESCGSCSRCVAAIMAAKPWPDNLMWPFIVCAECGNKRCPKANNHENECTGSNEPGQPGSSYPAFPSGPRDSLTSKETTHAE